ncbi:putative bifunctional diguanylate cyclase/phosphodiesterase [Pseudidiomarina gelatinasegens]|uniref:putative bifunctional diguanylate cyclase/phosphodiesterase n=1 Tax=Pseudidiomarina gelatinasegens TaxID=2487740 RepID=UPI003A97344D
MTSFRVERRLGYRILLWMLAVALVSGTVFSIAQIALDARRVVQSFDLRAEQTASLVRDAATQAAFSIDSDLAQQVVDGLFAQDAVHMARISHPDGESLAYLSRPLQESLFRPLTDPIFERERRYRVELIRSSEPDTHYGFLDIHYDTGPVAASWLERALVNLGSGIATALIIGLALFVVFHLLLTRPLWRIVQALKQVDPARPDERLIGKPTGHENDELGLWVDTTNNLLVAITDSQQRHREAEDRVSRLSRYDQLTGLPSRETFLGLLAADIAEARESDTLLAIFCLGLDDFKSINELYGFHTGDRILQTVAERLAGRFNEARFTLARLGGDQFVVVQKRLRDSFQAVATAENLLVCVGEAMAVGKATLTITATTGISLFPADASEPDPLLQNAEQTMALAKSSGRNHFQFYVASVDREIRERKQLEKDLNEALARNQLHLVYQPQVNLETRQTIGAEALLRWRHPKRGLVPPDQFIPLAELNGSIVAIGQWVLDQACWQASCWASAGLDIRMAVNLSAVQLRQDTIVDDILETLARHKIPPGRLELEVTETSFMSNLEDAVGKLHRLHDAGISLAVDDFGTGYSSLTYLKRMPVQHLKIDKQFVQDLLINDDDTRIATTIIDLGRSLNMTVVAEGVETAEQEAYLRQRGCALGQGYYFSRPVPADEFADFVAGFNGQIVENNA